MAFCPYMSYFAQNVEPGAVQGKAYPTTGNVYVGSTKVGTSRIHADTTNPSDTQFGAYVHMDCIEAECQIWDSRHNRCGIKVTDYNQGDGDGIIICGDENCTGGGGIPTAAILISEYHGNEDLDGNGKICGVDFHISDPPPMLKDSVPQDGTPMTMAEYKTSVGK